MHKKLSYIAVLILWAFSFVSDCRADEINVGVDVKCDDSTVEFSVMKVALETIGNSPKHKLDQNKPHNLMIIFAVSTIKDEKGEVYGAAIAILAVAKKTNSHSQIVYFGNEYTSLSDLKESIRKRVNTIIK